MCFPFEDGRVNGTGFYRFNIPFLLAVFKIGFVHFKYDVVHILRVQLSSGKKFSKLECEMLGLYFALFSVGFGGVQ